MIGTANSHTSISGACKSSTTQASLQFTHPRALHRLPSLSKRRRVCNPIKYHLTNPDDHTLHLPVTIDRSSRHITYHSQKCTESGEKATPCRVSRPLTPPKHPHHQARPRQLRPSTRRHPPLGVFGKQPGLRSAIDQGGMWLPAGAAAAKPASRLPCAVQSRTRGCASEACGWGMCVGSRVFVTESRWVSSW